MNIPSVCWTKVVILTIIILSSPVFLLGGEPLPFLKFSFSREFIFCDAVGSVFTAEIAVDQKGLPGEVEYILNMSILEKGIPAIDECLEGTFLGGPECIKETVLLPRVLTQDEEDVAIALLVKVLDERETEDDPGCPLFDPCVVNSFTWDDFSLTDSLCDTPRLNFEQSSQVIELLETLGNVAPGPLPLDNGDTNGDGNVNISDVSNFLGWLFLSGKGFIQFTHDICV